MKIPLNVKTFNVLVTFNRPTPVRMLATTTFRGLLGHVLAEQSPELIAKIFKPGFNSDTPAPYSLAPENNQHSPANHLNFKLITFDPDGTAIETFDQIIHFCEGKHFGTSGSIIKSCEMSPGRWFENVIYNPIPQKISINFNSPVSFKYNGKKVTGENFTLPLLIYAIYNTITRLCKYYSINGQKPSLPKWPDVLGNSYVQKNNLEWISPKRYSSSQETTLNLSGLVGNIIIPNPTEQLLQILNFAALTGIGKNTVHGCGRITWNRIQSNK